MSRKLTTRVGGAAAVASLAALAVFSSSSPAFADQITGGTLRPGEQRCVQQWASYQVRGDGWATGQGAKFKIQRYGSVVAGTGSPGLVTNWAAEARAGWFNFAGAGYYTACVTNNGSANTYVQLQLRTDAEFM